MNLDRLREMGEDLVREEARLLIKVANGEATDKEYASYKTAQGLVDEIQARLERASLGPTRIR